MIDTKQNNKVLVESYAISFVDKIASFRRNILGWQTHTGGDMFYVGGVETVENIFEKILSMKAPSYTLNIYYKGWEDE